MCLRKYRQSGRSLSSADNGEPDPPSASDQLVAHAAGAVYGYRRTNSEEALDTAYWNGFLYFELDFERTSDGKNRPHPRLGQHGRRMFGRAGQLTLEEFRTSDTFMDLTVMDLDDLLKWLDRHPDCFIITDIRPDNLSVLEEISESSGGQRSSSFLRPILSKNTAVSKSWATTESSSLCIYDGSWRCHSLRT